MTDSRIRIFNKTLCMWFAGLLLLMLICVIIPALFSGLSWLHFLFPVGIVGGPVVLMIHDRRLSRGNARNEKK
ncbi:MAG: hypothetical protein LBG14_07365 [Treponema sp.]|jgi:uncharacterized membrane protein (DUF4010 family)|nr:hypothetical protein [Treponema sp.]